MGRPEWTGNEHIRLVDLKVGDVVGHVELVPQECPVPLGLPCWHVLSVSPHQEAATAARLVEAGFRSRAFSVWRMEPTGQRDRYGHRQRVERERPMFPGYVFCDLRPGQHDFNKARKVKGAHDFLRDEERWPVSIPNKLVVMIEDREREERQKFLESIGPKSKRRADLAMGETVSITDGPLAQFVGQVSQLDDKGRVQLLLSMFGRTTKTWVEGEHLEKI